MVTPIETRYAGCLFRSRLEARWAVFFDTLGVPWRYEPEGFTLRDGERYLPDFYLAGVGWVEIKPSSEADNNKYDLFCFDSATDDQFHAFRFIGDIPPPSYEDRPDVQIEAFHGGMHGGSDTEYAWCVCSHCGAVGLQWHGRSDRICTLRAREFSANSARIKVAYIAARSARFDNLANR